MVGWHHRCDGHEFEQAPGVGDGQRSLACCSPWGYKESDTTGRLNNNHIITFNAQNYSEESGDCFPHFIPDDIEAQRSR